MINIHTACRVVSGFISSLIEQILYLLSNESSVNNKSEHRRRSQKHTFFSLVSMVTRSEPLLINESREKCERFNRRNNKTNGDSGKSCFFKSH